MHESITDLAAEGYYMPAEFSEHQATWMLWPERTDIWRLGGKPAQRVFADIANTLSEFESVVAGVNQSQYENARKRLSERVKVIELSYDDAWIRDTGPTFLINENGNLCGVDWFFNAWGGIGHITEAGDWNLTGSYFPWKLDDLVARKVLEVEGIKRYRCPLILEGGAIHVDGKGTLIATKECIQGRNPNMSASQIEDILSKYLGVINFIWLNRGLYLEENNGHIDNMCCFADARTILMNWCDDKNDPQYEISLEAFEVLSKAKNANGDSFTIFKISQPPALCITEEENSGVDPSEYAIPRLPNDRLSASYMNAYPCNGAVLIPSFATPFDERPQEYDFAALKAYQNAFKGRKVIQIPSRELLLGGGGIHCVLQQVPKNNLRRK